MATDRQDHQYRNSVNRHREAPGGLEPGHDRGQPVRRGPRPEARDLIPKKQLDTPVRLESTCYR